MIDLSIMSVTLLVDWFCMVYSCARSQDILSSAAWPPTSCTWVTFSTLEIWYHHLNTIRYPSPSQISSLSFYSSFKPDWNKFPPPPPFPRACLKEDLQKISRTLMPSYSAGVWSPFVGSNKDRATPSLVSFKGVIQASLSLSSGSCYYSTQHDGR